MNAPTTPSPPRMPAGHEFVRELARGGLGVVYLARNRTLNALRAIKRPYSRRDLEPESALDERALLARFRRERLAIGSLDHPHENIIRAYDAGEDDEGPYLIMEYLNGESLAGLLKRGGRLNVPEACELVRQAAIGLGVAHKLGLVHRDVKPSNLMLARTHDGARVVVIDWGLVKRLESNGSPDRLDDLFADRSLTSAGAAMGTPDYMSPDQILDATDVDARADIYSLGVTFYALFTGQAPFQDRKRRQEKLRGHIHDPFPRLVGIRSEVCAIIDKMVEKSPERRFATAEDVAKLLEPLCCGPRSPSLLALLDPPGSTATYPPRDNSPFEQETKLGALPLPDPDGPASPKAPPVDEAPDVGPPSAPILKPVPGLWTWGLAAGVLSGFLGWIADTALFNPHPYDDEAVLGMMLSLVFVEVAILAAVLGLAGGMARRSLWAGFRAAIIGPGLVAPAVAATWFSGYLFFNFLNLPLGPGGTLFFFYPLPVFFMLVAAGAPGLSFRLGLGVEGRWFPSALGGILGGIVASVVIGLFLVLRLDAFDPAGGKDLVLSAHILWAVLAAVGAVLPAVGRKPREARSESTPADTSNPICTPLTCLGIWVIAGLVSGLLWWVAEEDYPTGSLLEYFVRNGAILGAVLGLAGGIARRSARAAFRAAIVGGGLAAIEVAAAVNSQIFKGREGTLFNSLLIWAVVGAVPGLMLRLGLGGQGRWVRSALGGLLGAWAALVVIGVTGGRVSRVFFLMGWVNILIAVFVAVGAGLFAVGSRNPKSSG